MARKIVSETVELLAEMIKLARVPHSLHYIDLEREVLLNNAIQGHIERQTSRHGAADLGGLDLSFMKLPFNFAKTILNGVNLSSADLIGAKGLNEVDSYEGVILSFHTNITATSPSWLKQVHEVALRNQGFATWKDGKAQVCDAEGRVLAAQAATPATAAEASKPAELAKKV